MEKSDGNGGVSVAVLITYHDEKQLLVECLDSLMGQATVPNEVVVYDDGSASPAAEYVPSGMPVRIVRAQENRGPCHARNALLTVTQSDYLHFHDADDLFRTEWCRRVRLAIEATNADVVFTEIESFSDDGVPVCNRVLSLSTLVEDGDLVRFCLRGSMLVPAGTYRRSAVSAIGGYREGLQQSEDLDFHVRLAASGVRYAVITDPLVAIRIRAAGRSQNRIEVWSSAVEAIRLLSSELGLDYRADLADAAARAGSRLFKLGAIFQARDAFSLAQELGPARFIEQRWLYRTLATKFGAERTEKAGLLYRRVLPVRVRSYLANKGW